MLFKIAKVAASCGEIYGCFFPVALEIFKYSSLRLNETKNGIIVEEAFQGLHRELKAVSSLLLQSSVWAVMSPSRDQTRSISPWWEIWVTVSFSCVICQTLCLCGSGVPWFSAYSTVIAVAAFPWWPLFQSQAQLFLSASNWRGGWCSAMARGSLRKCCNGSELVHVAKVTSRSQSTSLTFKAWALEWSKCLAEMQCCGECTRFCHAMTFDLCKSS